MCVDIEILERECDHRKQGGSYKNGPTTGSQLSSFYRHLMAKLGPRTSQSQYGPTVCGIEQHKNKLSLGFSYSSGFQPFWFQGPTHDPPVQMTKLSVSVKKDLTMINYVITKLLETDLL